MMKLFRFKKIRFGAKYNKNNTKCPSHEKEENLKPENNDAYDTIAECSQVNNEVYESLHSTVYEDLDNNL